MISSLTTESWPFHCNQLTLGRIVIFLSLILTLEQNILITITSWQPLVFILSSSVDSADALHIFSLCFETLFVTRQFNWALLHLLRFKRRDTRQNVFSFTFVSYNRTYFCQIFSKNWQLKTLLTFVCGYKQVLGSLQAGSSTHYLAIIETSVVSSSAWLLNFRPAKFKPCLFNPGLLLNNNYYWEQYCTLNMLK